VKIEFPNRQAVDDATGGINFPAMVDGNQVTCKVLSGALQDIVPENSTDSVEQQFNENRSTFEDIARRKIENGNKDIIITVSDIKPKDI